MAEVEAVSLEAVAAVGSETVEDLAAGVAREVGEAQEVVVAAEAAVASPSSSSLTVTAEFSSLAAKKMPS